MEGRGALRQRSKRRAAGTKAGRSVVEVRVEEGVKFSGSVVQWVSGWVDSGRYE